MAQARPLLGRALQKEDYDLLADPCLEKNYDGSEIFRMIEAAASCVRHSSAKRPTMGQVHNFCSVLLKTYARYLLIKTSCKGYVHSDHGYAS